MAYPKRGVDVTLTTDSADTVRLKVDSQQVSFEEGRQFKYFDELDAISSTNQIVYKITTGDNPVNIIWRQLSVRSGGREYLIYPASDGDHTFTGTLADSGRISRVAAQYGADNANVTIQRAVGAGIFVAGSNPTIGTMSVADTNVNRATPVFSPDELRAGINANSEVYVVLNHIGSNDDTIGQYALYWEEVM